MHTNIERPRKSAYGENKRKKKSKKEFGMQINTAHAQCS